MLWADTLDCIRLVCIFVTIVICYVKVVSLMTVSKSFGLYSSLESSIAQKEVKLLFRRCMGPRELCAFGRCFVLSVNSTICHRYVNMLFSIRAYMSSAWSRAFAVMPG